MSSGSITTRSRAKKNIDNNLVKNGEEDTKKKVIKKEKSNDTNSGKDSSNKATKANGNKNTSNSAPEPKTARGRKKKNEEENDVVSKDNEVKDGDGSNIDESSSKGSNTTKDNTKSASKVTRGRKKKNDVQDESDTQTKKIKNDNTTDDTSTNNGNVNDPEEPPEDPSPNVPSRGRKRKNNVKEESDLNEKKEKTDNEKKVVEQKKVRMPVDPFATSRQHGWSVFEDKDLGPYSMTLNQTDVSNNNNKFIVLQVLKKDDSDNFSFFQRWGRVGFNGQCNLINGNQTYMVNSFEAKFKDKTGHKYSGHIEYEKKPKKYFPIEMKGEEVEPEDEKAPSNIPDSKLDSTIKRIMELICDTKLMAKTLKDMNFDLEKMPLGKLSKKQITAGYECLKAIETAIAAKNKPDIIEAVNRYYTNIPHFFGMRTPKLIETMDDLKKEIELLDALWEIEATMKTIKEEKPKNSVERHPMDDFYDKMKCELKVLPPKNKMRKTIEDVVKNTQGPTHTWYKYNVKNVLEVKRDTEDDKFLKDIPNKKLLWHGSRITNWYGILSQGLRIAPKEAPVTGYMFDKGIYLADLSSKSINYCYASPGETGFLALVEAAIGNPNVKFNSDCSASRSLKNDQHSVKGQGRMIPGKEIKLENGTVLYNGPIVDNKEHKPEDLCLYYNEYIVYNTDQVRLRYLVELEFCKQ